MKQSSLPNNVSLNLPLQVIDYIDYCLKEDVYFGDITTQAIVSKGLLGRAYINTREPLVVSGIDLAQYIFNKVDPFLICETYVTDSEKVLKNKCLLSVSGSMSSILTAERTVLNFLGKLSGIATHTSRYVEAVSDTNSKVVDTRKTTPGMRFFEKKAVLDGGGANHRFNLSDGILIKDNHIATAGSVSNAIILAQKNRAHHLVRIEVEVDTLKQLEEVLLHDIDVIMLDNMSSDQLLIAVDMVKNIAKKNIVLEASGGIRLHNIREIAKTGVDYISVGDLIHGARWVDVGLDMDTPS